MFGKYQIFETTLFLNIDKICLAHSTNYRIKNDINIINPKPTSQNIIK